MDKLHLPLMEGYTPEQQKRIEDKPVNVALLGRIVKDLSDTILQRFKALEKRIEVAVKNQPGHRLSRGTWAAGKIVRAQDKFVTHHGSLWHCNVQTTEAPGTAGGFFTLAVKAGRDAR